VTARSALLAGIDALALQAGHVVAGTADAATVADVRMRLQRPLRVAIAGRSKAGKSTLLNALVGERLAATDATECTRVVTWYRHDLGYSVAAELRDGTRRALDFERRDDAVAVRLDGLSIAEVERLEVGWPSSRLQTVTLIDTPGLDSTQVDGSERTMDALVSDEPEAGQADAVVYLMRHLHQRDAEFLEAFSVDSLGTASPVNAVALLSRADEIGGGRLDALSSAKAIAARYAADRRLQSRVAHVVAIAGLLAETAATLRESEVAALRLLTALPVSEQDALLLSVDRFRATANPVAEEPREQLLARFGLFGLRFATARLRADPLLGAAGLARLLVDASGVREVDDLIRRTFSGRADVLKARSALARLRRLAAKAVHDSRPGSTALASDIERLASSSSELMELRLVHGIHAGWFDLRDTEGAELTRVLAGGSPAARLGQPDDVPAGELRPLAIAAIDRWRSRAAHPLLDRATMEAAEGAIRAYERLYQELALRP
jgi:hypothetical protein